MKIKTEKIDTLKEGIDENKYIYMLCRCPTPVNIVHRALRPKEPGYYSSFCKDCNTYIGIHVLNLKN